jgi:ABC-2 type transport system permease protein
MSQPKIYGFWTLFKRESLRFLTLPNQTVLPALVSTALYVLVFGFVLGSKVALIEGHSFIVFVFPGLLLMSVVIAAFQNTSTTLFIARYEHFIDDLLVAPISYTQMVGAFILAALVRGLLTGLGTFLVGWLMTESPIPNLFLLLLNLSVSSVLFGAAGLVCGLWAERWDHIAIFQNYVVTPLVFLGGVFYSTSSLPEGFRWINELNPLYYMVAGTRHAYLGHADASFGLSFLVTIVLAVIFLVWAVDLFRRGYKLRS